MVRSRSPAVNFHNFFALLKSCLRVVLSIFLCVPITFALQLLLPFGEWRRSAVPARGCTDGGGGRRLCLCCRVAAVAHLGFVIVAGRRFFLCLSLYPVLCVLFQQHGIASPTQFDPVQILSHFFTVYGWIYKTKEPREEHTISAAHNKFSTQQLILNCSRNRIVLQSTIRKQTPCNCTLSLVLMYLASR